MTIKDQSAVDAEVAALKALLKSGKVPHHTAFGDDNHARINTQIEVLDGGMGTDEIYDFWGEEGDEADEDLLGAALDAQMWRDGESDSQPSKDWD